MKTLSMLLIENRDLLAKVISAEGEIDQVLEFEKDSNEAAIIEKIDAYYFVMGSIEAHANFLKEEEAKLKASREFLENKVERIKQHLKEKMREFNISELSGNSRRFVLSRSKPSVDIYNEELLPGKYVAEKVIHTADKNLIKEALTQGEDVPGARLKESYSLKSYVGKNIKELT